MGQSLDVIGIGSAFVDYFFEGSNGFLKRNRLENESDILIGETKLTIKKIFEELPLLGKSPGSIPGNTIAVLSKLGLNTGFYSVVGEDKDGDFWIENIGKIDKSRIIRSGTMNICACILTNRRNARAFISKLNPKDNLFFKNLDINYLNSPKVVHIGPNLLDSKNNIGRLIKIVEKISIPKISFSPSIYYARFGISRILPILKKTDILFLNENEIKILTRDASEKGSKILREKGIRIVVCTMGEKGVLITTKEKQFFSPAINVRQIMDTTGAGDTFAAGFLYGLLRNKSLEGAASFANKLASQSISDYGLNWLNRV